MAKFSCDSLLFLSCEYLFINQESERYFNMVDVMKVNNRDTTATKKDFIAELCSGVFIVTFDLM